MDEKPAKSSRHMLSLGKRLTYAAVTRRKLGVQGAALG